MEEEKRGVTLGDICRTIFSQKWLALIIAAVIFVAGTLALYLGYGPKGVNYVSTFSVNVSVNSDGMLVYPNNEKLNYRDLVSKNNLNAVKAGNEKFEAVKADDLYRRNAIQISQRKSDTGEITYTLTASAQYFPSDEVATEFLAEIAGTPSRSILAWVKGLPNDIQSAYDAKVGNEEKVAYVKNQLDAINARFASLGSLPITATEQVKNLLTTMDNLERELEIENYESDVRALQNYAYRLDELALQLEVADQVLAEIDKVNVDNASGATIMLDTTTKAYWLEKKATLSQEIKKYEKYLEHNGIEKQGESYVIPESVEPSAKCKAFDAKLAQAVANLKALISEYEVGYYAQTSLISYDGAQVIKTGGMGLTTSALLSLVVGLVLACVVAYVVGWNKNRKLAGESAQSAEKPEYFAPAVADAAVTDEDKKN